MRAKEELYTLTPLPFSMQVVLVRAAARGKYMVFFTFQCKREKRWDLYTISRAACGAHALD